MKHHRTKKNNTKQLNKKNLKQNLQKPFVRSVSLLVAAEAERDERLGATRAAPRTRRTAPIDRHWLGGCVGRRRRSSGLHATVNILIRCVLLIDRFH